MLAIVAALVIVIVFSGSRVVGHVFASRVSRAVAKGGKARVEFGTVLYQPPYSIYASDVHVLVRRPDGVEAQRLAAGSITLSLDHFPRPGEPISIQSLIVRHALINLGDRPDPVALDRVELSVHETDQHGVFEGRAVVSDNLAGSVTAEGRFDVGGKRLQLDKINGALRVAPLMARLPLRQNVQVGMDLVAPDGKIGISGSATIPLHDLKGSDYRLAIDLENVTGKIPRIKADLKDGRGRITFRPSAAGAGAIEASIELLHVASNKGRVELNGGVATLRPREGTWDVAQALGTVELGNELPLFLPHSGWFFNEGQFNGPIRFTLAAGGPFKLAGRNPFEVIRHEFLAYPRDLSVRPKNFVAPIEHITGGPIAFRGGVVSFQNLTGTYGHDKLLLRNARLILEDPTRRIAIQDLRTQVKFEEISGTVVFDRSSPPYPGVVGKTVAQLQPQGPFVIGGGTWYAINRPPRYEPWVKFKPDYFVRLLGDGGSMALRPYDVPLTEVQGQATISPMSVEIAGFNAKSLGGSTWADGQIVPGKPFLYQGRIDARGVDLAALASTLPLDEKARRRLTGTAAVSVRLAGAGKGGPKSPLELLMADGEWEVLHGEFWSVPAVENVASRVKKTEELGTGDAAGVIHIAENKITFDNAAINSPFLGLQGHGTIGFDKSLDLTVVAAPLGDWRDRMKQAGVPVVGDILGAIQQLVNTAQGTLLYQFKVTGSLSHPNETLIPAPVFTQPMAYLFGQMLKPDENGKLLTNVKHQSVAAEEPMSKAQPASARQQAH